MRDSQNLLRYFYGEQYGERKVAQSLRISLVEVRNYPQNVTSAGLRRPFPICRSYLSIHPYAALNVQDRLVGSETRPF